MPKKAFDMNFSSEERQTLESLRKNIRHRIASDPSQSILLADEGLSNDVIAARLETPRQIVSKWRKRFALARLPGLESQPRA